MSQDSSVGIIDSEAKKAVWINGPMEISLELCLRICLVCLASAVGCVGQSMNRALIDDHAHCN